MADVKPFRAVTYNDRYSDQLDKLITPPYDVISSSEQQSFYESNPYNIIRLVLGKQFSDDSESNNRYTRAAATMQEWLDQKVLIHKPDEAFVLYRMEFRKPEGESIALDGIIGLIKVDDYGVGKVLPHEKTYKGPKLDQLNLLRACKANFTPIHGLFDDPSNEIAQEYQSVLASKPEQQTVDKDGTIHKTWSITDKELIQKISGALSHKSVFIADGHHRYETSLAYRKEVEESGNAIPGGAHEYVMMYLTSMSHPGLTILPAHRMVKGIDNVSFDSISNALNPYFDIEPLCFSPSDRDKVGATMVRRIHSYSDVGGKFGMVLQGDTCFYLLRLKDFSAIQDLISSDVPSSLRGLDVTILREVIMSVGLGLDVDASEGKIEYTPLISEAMAKALDGEVQASFILNATRVDQMREAAELGHKLPHKSTYFFPKLSSGLVLNVF